MSGVGISGAGQGFEVNLSGGPYGPYTATPSFVDGTFTIPGVKYLSGGSDYVIDADHSLYLKNLKTPLTVNAATVTGQNTKLPGGDTDDSGQVYIEDMTCIGGAFNTVPTPTSCTVGSPDINADNKVNIQDLSIAGGNYSLYDATTAVPRWSRIQSLD